MHAACMQAAFTTVMQAAYRRSTVVCSLHTVVCRLQTTVCSTVVNAACMQPAYIRMQHAYDGTQHAYGRMQGVDAGTQVVHSLHFRFSSCSDAMVYEYS